jgi:hypothetical protein
LEKNYIYYKQINMKHILNNLTEQEKNAIREQHTGGMKVATDKFSQLLESKLGDVKPILSEQSQSGDYKVGQVLKAKRDKDGQVYTIKVKRIIPDGTNIVASIQGPGTYEGGPIDGRGIYELYAKTPGELAGNMEMGTFTIVK